MRWTRVTAPLTRIESLLRKQKRAFLALRTSVSLASRGETRHGVDPHLADLSRGCTSGQLRGRRPGGGPDGRRRGPAGARAGGRVRRRAVRPQRPGRGAQHRRAPARRGGQGHRRALAAAARAARGRRARRHRGDGRAGVGADGIVRRCAVDAQAPPSFAGGDLVRRSVGRLHDARGARRARCRGRDAAAGPPAGLARLDAAVPRTDGADRAHPTALRAAGNAAADAGAVPVHALRPPHLDRPPRQRGAGTVPRHGRGGHGAELGGSHRRAGAAGLRHFHRAAAGQPALEP
jgi:hypothetical protein